MQHPSQSWNWKNPSIGRCHSWCSRLMPFKHVMPSKTILSDTTINLYTIKRNNHRPGWLWLVHGSWFNYIWYDETSFWVHLLWKVLSLPDTPSDFYDSSSKWIDSTDPAAHTSVHHPPSAQKHSLLLVPSPPPKKKKNDIWNPITKHFFTNKNHSKIPINSKDLSIRNRYSM